MRIASSSLLEFRIRGRAHPNAIQEQDKAEKDPESKPKRKTLQDLDASELSKRALDNSGNDPKKALKYLSSLQTSKKDNKQFIKVVQKAKQLIQKDSDSKDSKDSGNSKNSVKPPEEEHLDQDETEDDLGFPGKQWSSNRRSFDRYSRDDFDDEEEKDIPSRITYQGFKSLDPKKIVPGKFSSKIQQKDFDTFKNDLSLKIQKDPSLKKGLEKLKKTIADSKKLKPDEVTDDLLFHVMYFQKKEDEPQDRNKKSFSSKGSFRKDKIDPEDALNTVISDKIPLKKNPTRFQNESLKKEFEEFSKDLEQALIDMDDGTTEQYEEVVKNYLKKTGKKDLDSKDEKIIHRLLFDNYKKNELDSDRRGSGELNINTLQYYEADSLYLADYDQKKDPDSFPNKDIKDEFDEFKDEFEKRMDLDKDFADEVKNIKAYLQSLGNTVLDNKRIIRFIFDSERKRQEKGRSNEIDLEEDPLEIEDPQKRKAFETYLKDTLKAAEEDPKKKEELRKKLKHYQKEMKTDEITIEHVLRKEFDIQEDIRERKVKYVQDKLGIEESDIEEIANELVPTKEKTKERISDLWDRLAPWMVPANLASDIEQLASAVAELRKKSDTDPVKTALEIQKREFDDFLLRHEELMGEDDDSENEYRRSFEKLVKQKGGKKEALAYLFAKEKGVVGKAIKFI